MQQPHRIKVGAGVIMLSMDGIAADWGVSLRAIHNIVKNWQLPTFTPEKGGKSYVSLYSLETALFEALLPRTFQGDHEFVKAHHELAGCLYGTMTKEIIRERCMQLASQLKKGPKRIHHKDRNYPKTLKKRT